MLKPLVGKTAYRNLDVDFASLYCYSQSGLSFGARIVELTWLMRLRIAAVAAIGIVLVGILGWHTTVSLQPFGAIRAGSVGISGLLILLVLAAVSGALGYFAAWPHGREIGILAAPFGLGYWGIRGGNMANLFQMTEGAEQRMQLLSGLKWEPLFWLAVVAAGFAAVLVVEQLVRPQKQSKDGNDAKASVNKYLQWAIALLGSVLIAQICISLFVQNVEMADNRLNWVVGQPTVGQIVFGLVMAFGVAGFVAKKFLDSDYILPAVSTVFVTAFVIIAYMKAATVDYMTAQWPGAFFTHSAVAILPVQMVAFGCIGAVAGYWTARRFDYWRQNESE